VRKLIPWRIIDATREDFVVPSAELSEDQNVDEGKGDPIYYPYHDNVLRMFIEKRWDPGKILGFAVQNQLDTTLGVPEGTVAKFFKTRTEFVANLEWSWRQYNIEYKRHQLPPVLICSRRAFGFDRRDTIADAYFTNAYNTLKAVYLKQAA
jgi:NAD+ synthase (glutamine-hydrolysing)